MWSRRSITSEREGASRRRGKRSRRGSARARGSKGRRECLRARVWLFVTTKRARVLLFEWLSGARCNRARASQSRPRAAGAREVSAAARAFSRDEKNGSAGGLHRSKKKNTSGERGAVHIGAHNRLARCNRVKGWYTT